MRRILLENRLFFSYLGLFIVLGGLFLLFTEKGAIILFFSENRSSWANLFFRSVTHLGEAPAFIIAAIIALFYQARYALAIGGTGLAVMGISFGLKALFAIDRPAAFFRKTALIDQINLVDGVVLHSGATSFPSGHTMAAFALYSLLAFLLPKRPGYATAFFILAFFVGLSRVYLVQHFWQDVYAGALTGVLIGMAAYAIQERFRLSVP